MSKSLNIEEFIRRSNLIHKNKYDYSKVIYKNQYTHILINCPIHGEFNQIPKSHMSGHGCSKCASRENAEKIKGREKINKLDKQTILNRLAKIYKEYDYSQCEIEGTGDNAIIKNIICAIHGAFSKRLNNHLRLNQGCQKCTSKVSNMEDFIENAKIIHQNKYDYSDCVYTTSKNKIPIKCTQHGIFKQTPSKHLSGQGCPVCYNLIASKGELFIKQFLSENNIEFEYQKNIKDTKLKFDFYIPHKNMYIEYDGIQHFEPRDRFGGDTEYHKQIKRDRVKDNYCRDNKIFLLRINYKDYKNLYEILALALL